MCQYSHLAFVFQSLHNTVRHETLALAHHRIDSYPLRLPKSNKGVDVVGHDHIAKDVVPFALKVIKPLVHLTIGIGNFEQPQPTATGNRNEIDAAVLCYLPANRHIRKLAFCVPRISFHSRRVPETGNSAGKENAHSPAKDLRQMGERVANARQLGH